MVFTRVLTVIAAPSDGMECKSEMPGLVNLTNCSKDTPGNPDAKTIYQMLETAFGWPLGGGRAAMSPGHRKDTMSIYCKAV